MYTPQSAPKWTTVLRVNIVPAAVFDSEFNSKNCIIEKKSINKDGKKTGRKFKVVHVVTFNVESALKVESVAFVRYRL